MAFEMRAVVDAQIARLAAVDAGEKAAVEIVGGDGG